MIALYDELIKQLKTLVTTFYAAIGDYFRRKRKL